MMELEHNEGRNFPVSRFENMLKTNEVLFFDADEFELIITHYLEIGKMALARKATKIAFEQHPASSGLKLLKVEILIFEERLEEANELLQELYDIEPYNPEIYIQKASIFSKQNQHEESVEVLKNAAELLGDDEEVFSQIAMEYMFLEDFEKAKVYFMKCLHLDEEDITALYNIIHCFDYLDQPEEAIEFLNLFIDQHPYSSIAWHQMGLQYTEIENLEKALDCFDYAIISDDYFLGAYMEKAKILEELERYQDAIECYETTLELEDATAFAYLHIGLCYEQLKKFDIALEYFNKSLQEDPLLDKTWMAITDFYCHQNQYRQALYYIEKAIAIDEENIHYWKRYAQINTHLNRHKEAAKALLKSEELSQEEFENHITTCDVLIQGEAYDNALEEMEDVEQDFPNTVEIEFRLAGLYLLVNDTKLGLFHLKKALSLDSDYVFLLRDLFPAGTFEQQEVQRVLNEYGIY